MKVVLAGATREGQERNREAERERREMIFASLMILSFTYYWDRLQILRSTIRGVVGEWGKRKKHRLGLESPDGVFKKRYLVLTGKKVTEPDESPTKS